MVENIVQGKYSEAVDSYSSLNMSSKIRGTLIEKDDKNIKIDIGNNQALEIELKENVDIKSGETVLIDRRNILKSKVVKLEEKISIDQSETEIYTDILKKLDIEVTDVNIKTIKKLESYGIDITKENFESYTIAKNSLEEISTSLDYDSAIRLVEMDLDIENESIQKIAHSLEELEEEKEGFNILKMFGKKQITTEQAEEIAKELYGNKMGKDITDIIKSLHKNKVSITKKNIEKINDVFYKLHNLKDIEDKTFVDTIKNKLDINIENLYRIKRYVKDESNNIEVEMLETKAIVNIKAYEVPTKEKRNITNKELKLLEEDIKELMLDLKLDTSEENIKLSKEFIKRNMDITKENILHIDEMKKALEIVIKHLDHQTASLIVKENIDIESSDIKKIAEKIIEIKNLDKSVLLTLTQENISALKTEEQINLEENIDKIINKIKLFKDIEDEDILTLLEKNVDFKINKIEEVIFGKREAISMNTIEDITYSASEITKVTADGIGNISTAFRDIGKLDFNTIAFQIKRNIPMTIMNMQKTTLALNSAENQKQLIQGDESTRLIEALTKNDLLASRLNIQKSMEAYRNYNNIKENLTSNMIKATVIENIQIEHMDISLASKYLDQYIKSNPSYSNIEQMETVRKTSKTDKEKYAKTFTETAYDIAENIDENIMFLIKNRKPLSFKELQETHSRFKNKDQIGHKISEIMEYINGNNDGEIKEKFERLKEDIIGISKSMKNSTDEVEKAYKRMEDSIKDIEKSINLLNQEQNSLMNKKSKEISEKLDENKVIAKENDIIQFPLFMNGQFTNLNMYFRDKEREKSNRDPEDISVMLSIDTVNMGSLNIGLEIEKKNIDIRIALKNMDDKNHMTGYKDNLIEILEQDGYSVREIEFYKAGEVDTFLKEDISKIKPIISKGNLDIKI